MAALLPPPPRAPQVRPAESVSPEVRTLEYLERPLEPMAPIAVTAPTVSAPSSDAPTGWFARFVSTLVELLSDWPNQRCPNCLRHGAALRVTPDEVFPLVAPSHRCGICGDLWILPRPEDLG